MKKLDDRYFIGLEGQYIFTLFFRIEKEGETDYIVRSHGNYNMKRSVNVDIELEAGKYFVLMKISAKRDIRRPNVEEVIRDNCRAKQDKLIQIGQSYDLAHAKGQTKESEAEKLEREAREEKKRAAEKKRLHAKLREQKLRHWQLAMKQRARERRHSKRKEERHRKKAEAGAMTEGTAQDGKPATEDPPVEGHPSEDATNGVATAESGSDPADAKVQPVQDAANLPSPPADLPSQAASLSPDNPSAPSDAETEPQGSAPTKATEVTAPAEVYSSNAPAQEAATQEQSQKFASALQAVPSILVNGTTSGPEPAPPSTAAGPTPDDSDYASDASFDSSVDSDLDFLEGQEAAVPAAVEAESDDEDAEFTNDPWNAFCVVGLRVYSKDQDTVVQVVRPAEDEDDTDDADDADDEPPRDVDDISKGASKEPVEDTSETKTGQEE